MPVDEPIKNNEKRCFHVYFCLRCTLFSQNKLKVLLFLEALQTTKVSKTPPFPTKTSMGNELFLESEIFPPPRTQKEH